MSRHQDHLHLLDHLIELGYQVTTVSKGSLVCTATLVQSPDGAWHHQFDVEGKRKTSSPPFPSLPLKILLAKGSASTLQLRFTIQNQEGSKHALLGWKELAKFVQEKVQQKQDYLWLLAH